MFKYSTRGGPGKVSIGCQAPMGESTGWWEGSQDLSGASFNLGFANIKGTPAQ